MRCSAIFITLFVVLKGFADIQEPMFLQKLNSPRPQWMKDQTTSDFSCFKEVGISQDAINETYLQCINTVLANFGEVPKRDLFSRYRIIDNRIYRFGAVGSYVEHALIKLSKVLKLPNVDFLLCHADGAPESYHVPNFWITKDIALQAPLLTRGTLKDAKYIVLIPDYSSFDSEEFFRKIRQMSGKIPWKRKRKAAYWRGAPSDFHKNQIDRLSYEETESIYTTRPRFKISVLSTKHPKKVNAGITRSFDHAPHLTKLLNKAGVMKPSSSQEAHLYYAYLPCLDGWMCTYPGLMWRLVSNSVVFKHDSEQVLWFYKALKPYEHYIPIKHQCEDLLEKIEWAKLNETKCKNIARQSTRLALSELTNNDAFLFLYDQLKKYESLQVFDLKGFSDQTENSSEWQRLL